MIIRKEILDQLKINERNKMSYFLKSQSEGIFSQYQTHFMNGISFNLQETKSRVKMNRKYISISFFILFLAISWYFFSPLYFTQSAKYSKDPSITIRATAPGVPMGRPNIGTSNHTIAGWKTYSNRKYGFEFQYPPTWIKDDKDIEAVNTSGILTSIQISFSDSLKKNRLLVVYNLSPMGAEIYKFAHTQYDSIQGPYAHSRNMIDVAGNKAIQANSEISIDGRGNTINPPIKLILIDFPDRSGEGEFQFQLKTTQPSVEVEVIKLKKLLSTFRFTN